MWGRSWRSVSLADTGAEAKLPAWSPLTMPCCLLIVLTTVMDSSRGTIRKGLLQDLVTGRTASAPSPAASDHARSIGMDSHR